MSDSPAPGQIVWRLRELMAQRNQMSQSEMARALESDGAHPISRTQVGRMMARVPTNLPVALIAALCRILKCSPDELFGWQSPPPAVDLNPLLTAIGQQGRERRGAAHVPDVPRLPGDAPQLDEHDRARIVGPAARALPAHVLARKPK